ncbi:MAG: LUD domain-containing protein [Terracidiphilus sp.]
MSTSTPSRQLILNRIRTATKDAAKTAYADLKRPYTRRGTLGSAARLQLMIERLREYDADVVECVPDRLPATIAACLASSRRTRFVAPEGLPSAWLAAGFDWKIDHGLEHAEIELCEGVVTTSFAGIADSGTIVLHHSGSEGRRVITLLPDWHLCILRASQVVETLPEYFARCPEPPALATYISGPSATADIEMTRIKGVHGPRFLNVILVRDVIETATGSDQPGASQAGNHESL